MRSGHEPLKNQDFVRAGTIVRDMSDNCQVLLSDRPSVSRPVNAYPNPTRPTTNIAVDRGYQPERVFRMTCKVDYTSTPYTKLHYWTGKDHGYGYTHTPKLFCNSDCGRLFGLAAWRAGYRMKGHE